MHPVFLDLGFVQIRYYGLMYAMALLAGIKLILSELRRRGVQYVEDQILNIIITAFLGALLFARIYYVVFNFAAYQDNLWEILAVWHGGLAIHGGILGGVLCGYWACRHYKIEPWLFADVCAPAVLLGQALGRFGNLMNGDAHGLPTDLPWGLVFAPGTPAGIEFPGVPLHPTMLYEMLLNLLFCGLLYRLQKTRRRNGFVFCLYLIFYSIARFIVSFWRADDFYLLGFNLPQLVSIGLIAVSLYFMLGYRLYDNDKA
ncbi:MAG: prolipoprotein diacylglyceryl transferase [Candidatus Margulisbacteria bacterium]|jgi:phosphatidylglycerol:prolipoprotein diacylglycerol transferase|nr:prolipoprotein diacylglyceryl transferase [Candidatus Margulisiibacteriota bacterium]